MLSASSTCTKKQLPPEPTVLEPVTFTEHVAAKIKQIITEENSPGLMLRIRIKDGGCNGFKYLFELDEIINEHDKTFAAHGITLVIESKIHRYLSGASIDYLEDVEGERFTIKNPNAKSSCGCGSSFDID